MSKSPTTHAHAQHCDLRDLDALLQGELAKIDQGRIEQHLSSCSECARRLESLAVLDSSWDETKSMLQIDEFDGQYRVEAISSFHSSEAFARSEERLRPHFEMDSMSRQQTEEILTREIKGWLDPTDDPQSLGRFAGYEIVGIVGHGGMGIVLKGFESSLHRYVAIKVLAPRLATNGSARLRFAREAQATAAVRHDNVIAIHRVDDWHGLPFLVMPYIAGISLQKRIDTQGPLAVDQALRVGVQIASGLAAAHAQGLVHRDIKPANILLEHGVERITITDFGLARAVDDASVTLTGVIAGTPQYMSPEQAEASPIDARSDLFSLGSVLYTMVTGRPPFRGLNSFEVLQKIVHRDPLPMREVEPSVPEWFQRIVSKLHSKEPSERPETAGEVAKHLEDCLAHVRQPTIHALPRLLRTVTSATSNRWITPRWTYPWIAAGMLFAMFFAGTLIVLELDKGKLTIESESENIPVRILKGEQVVERITMTLSPASVRIAAGTYTVEIDGDYQGIAIENSKFSLSRGGEEKVKIVLKQDLSKTQVQQPDQETLDYNKATELYEYTDAYKKEMEASLVSKWSGSGPAGPIQGFVYGLDKKNINMKADKPLVDAVADFNDRLARTSSGHDQPHLTAAEVITCASWNLQYGKSLSSRTKEGLRMIAQKRQWPIHWTIDGGFVTLPPESAPVAGFRIKILNEEGKQVIDVRLRCLAPPDEFQKRTLEPSRAGRPLRDAVMRFNETSRFPAGRPQPYLTENEVIASILHSKVLILDHELSDLTIKMYEDIARTHMIPDNCSLELLTDFVQANGVTHTIWSIRLRIPYLDNPNFTYAFPIRDQYLWVTHGDAETIHWGQPGNNGLQAGVRLNPGLKSYDIGQRIGVEIYYRNIYTHPLKGMLPNAFTCESIEAVDENGDRLKFIDRQDREIVGGWMVTSFGDSPQEVHGPAIEFQAKEPEAGMSDVELASRPDLKAPSILIAIPGQRCRLHFVVKNYGDGDHPKLKTGFIDFDINQP